MKLLVVGNTYLTANNQKKYVEMKRQQESLVLKILTPEFMPHLFKNFTREISPDLTPQEVISISSYIVRSHMTYFLDPIHFSKIIREFKPNRVHIEEDPYSVVGVETVFLVRLLWPKAKISFFIWDNLAREPRFPLGAIKKLLENYGLSRADLVICGNNEGLNLLRSKKRYFGKAVVMPQMGVDSSLQNEGSRLQSRKINEEEIPLIGFSGRLIPEKGIIDLLTALSKLRHLNWRLMIMGAGPLEFEINSKWKRLFGDRLILLGVLSRDEVLAYMRKADIFVLPSCSTKLWKEQFGLVLAEAMLSGIACIGSTCGAIPEVIGSGGLIFKEGDIDSLRSKIEILLLNKQLRIELGIEGKRYAKSRYTNSAVSASYLKVFGMID